MRVDDELQLVVNAHRHLPMPAGGGSGIEMTVENMTPHDIDCDVVIIGAGPAGATAAKVLADRGHSVLVVERSRFPRFHIGESLLPYMNPLLHRLGLAEPVAEVGFPVKRGAEFTTTGRGFNRVDFTAQGGGRAVDTYQVERADFDAVLLREAARAGAVVWQDTRTSGVLTDGPGRITGARCTHGGHGRDIRARLVLDGSGRSGLIAHQQLRARTVDSRLRMVAVYRHFGGVDEANNPGDIGDIQIGSHQDGWVWAIPIREDKLSVGVVTAPEVVQSTGKYAVFTEHVGRIPRISQRLTGAGPVSEVRGESDFCYHTERLSGPGFFVLGDAGCFVDPIFSAGVFLAMISAERAAELAADILEGERTEKQAHDLYARFYKTGYDCYFRLIHAFYESGFKIGRYLKSTGFDVAPHWSARLLSGDFWSRKNPLSEHLRGIKRFDTFKPFTPLYGCPVYPDLDAHEPADSPLGIPLAKSAVDRSLDEARQRL